MRVVGVVCGVVVLACVLACGGGPRGEVATAAPTPGVKVAFARAAVRPADGLLPERLLVYVTITNETKARRLHWRQGPPSDSLRDEHGNAYRCELATPDRAIDPGETAEVFFGYAVPVKQAKRLTLTIDCKAHLGDGSIVAVVSFKRP